MGEGRRGVIEEPYRWLEAVANRREYIQDQLRGATPVFAVSRPEGVFLLGAGPGRTKVFEIYNRHGMAAVGNPVDMEKLRQSVIETAHMEGFNRSPGDVTLRRLVGFSISPALKNAFEQIVAAPLIVEALFAECGAARGEDVLARVGYDGTPEYPADGVGVVFPDRERERAAADWLAAHLTDGDGLARVRGLCLAAWSALMDRDAVFDTLSVPEPLPVSLPDHGLEIALIDRASSGPAQYRMLVDADFSP